MYGHAADDSLVDARRRRRRWRRWSILSRIRSLFSERKIRIVFERARPAAPLRRIITHAAPCATTVEAETTELIEDIVYRYFSTLCERVRMHQRYAIILRRVCHDDAKGHTRRGRLASQPLLIYQKMTITLISSLKYKTWFTMYLCSRQGADIALCSVNKQWSKCW